LRPSPQAGFPPRLRCCAKEPHGGGGAGSCAHKAPDATHETKQARFQRESSHDRTDPLQKSLTSRSIASHEKSEFSNETDRETCVRARARKHKRNDFACSAISWSDQVYHTRWKAAAPNYFSEACSHVNYYHYLRRRQPSQTPGGPFLKHQAELGMTCMTFTFTLHPWAPFQHAVRPTDSTNNSGVFLSEKARQKQLDGATPPTTQQLACVVIGSPSNPKGDIRFSPTACIFTRSRLHKADTSFRPNQPTIEIACGRYRGPASN
ncbi:unnamed protein product, partial [Ectocarpus fasciculatus]